MSRKEIAISAGRLSADADNHSTTTAFRKSLQGASTSALLLAGVLVTPAYAQDKPTDPVIQVEEVVVTGTRVVRNGYSAPTPTTVVGVEEIQKAAPANIADYVNQLPQLSANATPRVGNQNTSTGFNGLNNLNLRGLGANRTLVLLDGQRVVASALNGAVDVNNLPSALVQRVDIVTGGASAAYGSDAVAGVVNFVLNKKFTGLKGSVSTGQTSRSDDRTYNAELSYGRAFAGSKGHVLVSGEYGYVQGIDYLDPGKRKWFKSIDMLTFPVGTRPQRIVRENVNLYRVAQGGVITSTALANTQFGKGGVALPFVVGSPQAGDFMVGGNTWYEGNTVALDSHIDRYSLFGRVSYDLTPDVTLSMDASYGSSHTSNGAAYQRYPGSGTTALVMKADNAFLDPVVAARAASLGVTQFNYGYSSYDLGRPINDVERKTLRAVASLDGKLSNNWIWNAYYQYGRTDLDVALYNTTNKNNFTLAIDAVRNPANGQIVCRSSLTNPTNGCVPLNIFGYGVADVAAVRYVKGVARQSLRLTQDVAAASISGEPFSTWAGPVSTAVGAEWRKEAIDGSADPISMVNGFFTGNFKPTIGHYDVKEGFIETVIPLAKDQAFANALEFNGAVRYTDYSLAGGVTTWKAGLSWEPISDLRFRAVRSRDIRAPNVGELFQLGQSQRQDVIDSANPARPSVSVSRVTSGNLNLKPEIAKTLSLGFVYRPSWLPQFSASVDYYSINMSGAITTLGNQEIVDRCVRGESVLCGFIVRDAAGTITTLLTQPVNVAQQKTAGVDVESSWRQDLGDYGVVTLRGLVSHIDHLTTINGGVTTELAGQNAATNALSTPKWRWFTSLTYEKGRLQLNGVARGFSSGVYDNTWVEGVDIDDNDIKGATYVDLSGSFKLRSGEGDKLEAFFKVENLLDKDPEVVAGSAISSLHTNPALYDVIGRNFRIGVRFQY